MKEAVELQEVCGPPCRPTIVLVLRRSHFSQNTKHTSRINLAYTLKTHFFYIELEGLVMFCPTVIRLFPKLYDTIIGSK